jgi:hypothetical protein
VVTWDRLQRVPSRASDGGGLLYPYDLLLLCRRRVAPLVPVLVPPVPPSPATTRTGRQRTRPGRTHTTHRTHRTDALTAHLGQTCGQHRAGRTRFFWCVCVGVGCLGCVVGSTPTPYVYHDACMRPCARPMSRSSANREHDHWPVEARSGRLLAEVLGLRKTLPCATGRGFAPLGKDRHGRPKPEDKHCGVPDGAVVVGVLALARQHVGGCHRHKHAEHRGSRPPPDVVHHPRGGGSARA